MRTFLTVVAVVTATVGLSAQAIHAAPRNPPPPQTVSLEGGAGGRVGGYVQRTTDAGPQPGQATVQTTHRGAAPAAEKPDRDRSDTMITWTSDDAQLRYIFDDRPGMDYCSASGQGVTTCYGPEPPPDPRGRRRPPMEAPPISPQEIVEQTLVNVRLPEPQPNVDPGYAVTGLRAYLETGNDTTHTFPTIPTVLGGLSISASSTHTVDWGDGTTTGPHSSTGGKYPDGDITHVYKDTGVVDITVTQNWTATWSLAGQSGTISGLSSSGSIDDFVVREVQASRRR